MRRTLRGRKAPLHEVGENPDYRFTLANERTFLAWVRTALALMAAGVAVVQYLPGLGAGRHALGFLLVALGGVLAASSYSRWARNERAMRLGRRLPDSPLPQLLAGALTLVAVAAVALLVVDGMR